MNSSCHKVCAVVCELNGFNRDSKLKYSPVPMIVPCVTSRDLSLAGIGRGEQE